MTEDGGDGRVQVSSAPVLQAVRAALSGADPAFSAGANCRVHVAYHDVYGAVSHKHHDLRLQV